MVTSAQAGARASVEGEKSLPKLAMLTTATDPAMLSGTCYKTGVKHSEAFRFENQGNAPCSALCACPRRRPGLGSCRIDNCSRRAGRRVEVDNQVSR
jgi:hypothetical protein